MPEARSRKLARATTAAPKRAAPTFADPTRVASKPAASGAAHRVRIIGGVWKRTPLPVADADGLRPTPDRVRETVFNWSSERHRVFLPSCLTLDRRERARTYG